MLGSMHFLNKYCYNTRSHSMGETYIIVTLFDLATYLNTRRNYQH